MGQRVSKRCAGQIKHRLNVGRLFRIGLLGYDAGRDGNACAGIEGDMPRLSLASINTSGEFSANARRASGMFGYS